MVRPGAGRDGGRTALAFLLHKPRLARHTSLISWRTYRIHTDRRRALLFALCLLAAPAQAALLPAEGGDRSLYLGLVTREALLQGVPPALADAVAMVETGYRVDAVGSSGEVGMMQIMPATARQLGFSGSTSDLFQPATNVRLGVQYLSRAWAVSGGNVCRALMKYRAGMGEETMTPLSITYCARAMTWLDAVGSDLAQGAGTALPAPAPVPDPHVIALFPPLPEQAGLQAATSLPVVVTPAAYLEPALAPVRRSMADRQATLQARVAAHARHLATVDKTTAAVEAALSDN